MKLARLPAHARPIPGYPGYWITPGQIGVDPPRVYSNRGHNGPVDYWREVKNRFRQSSRCLRTLLKIDTKVHNVSIRSMVAQAFIGERPEGSVVCIDESDQALLCDPSLFAVDGSVRLRYEANPVGPDRAAIKLYAPEDRDRARQLFASGLSINAIANECNVSWHTAHLWVTGSRSRQRPKHQYHRVPII